jgi:hypothetical protein
MANAQALEPYLLVGPLQTLLQQCAANTNPPDPTLQILQTRPRPSQLRQRLSVLNGIPQQLLEPTYRSSNRAWEDYTVDLVNPSAFMRTPAGAPYEVVTTPDRSRGMRATRDISPGEIVLQ